MANVTLSVEDDLLRAGREYARKNNTTLNRMIREFLARTLKPKDSTLEECFRLMDRAKGNSRGRKWKREELYDV